MSPKVSIVATDSHRDLGPQPGVDVTFLPFAEDDGVPVYDESTPDLVRELQAAGVTVETWHAAGAYELVSSRGLVTDTLLQIGVGISSSAGWYGLQSLLRRRGGQLRVVAIFDDGVQRRRAEVTGEAADVVDVLERLDPFSSGPS
ncbi:hypothetical protein [Micromonospora sp. WMMD812]|uniref:hypothetical protein n=1 Tax=Micromonospora sp. WMMD812 TaxID=3015152 RepID=UPI00248CEB52|nr:hypothetical protein [Micromonospora sp. WMMD812]WBB68304.1 hypothetical protein O7603_02680 [Micromonospora sp. WMMD812]